MSGSPDIRTLKIVCDEPVHDGGGRVLVTLMTFGDGHWLPLRPDGRTAPYREQPGLPAQVGLLFEDTPYGEGGAPRTLGRHRLQVRCPDCRAEHVVLRIDDGSDDESAPTDTEALLTCFSSVAPAGQLSLRVLSAAVTRGARRMVG